MLQPLLDCVSSSSIVVVVIIENKVFQFLLDSLNRGLLSIPCQFVGTKSDNIFVYFGRIPLGTQRFFRGTESGGIPFGLSCLDGGGRLRIQLAQ